MAFRVVLLLFGTFCCATAVIIIKSCSIDPVALAGYRLVLASFLLLPVFLRDWHRNRQSYRLDHLKRSILPGVVLGMHFTTWIIGARLTLAANANLIVNFIPLTMPFALFLLIREKLNKSEIVGTLLAISGVVLLTGVDYRLRPDHFLGDLICFGSMLLLTVYLALSRKNRDFPTIWLYLVPLYFVGGVACLLAAVLARRPMGIASAHDWLMMILLGAIPTVIGHSILNNSMKHLRGQVVSIANLSQFIYATLMGMFFLYEIPKWNFYPAAALIVLGAILALRAMPHPSAANLPCNFEEK